MKKSGTTACRNEATVQTGFTRRHQRRRQNTAITTRTVVPITRETESTSLFLAEPATGTPTVVTAIGIQPITTVPWITIIGTGTTMTGIAVSAITVHVTIVGQNTMTTAITTTTVINTMNGIRGTAITVMVMAATTANTAMSNMTHGTTGIASNAWSRK